MKRKTPEQRITDLLMEVIKVTRELARAKSNPVQSRRSSGRVGIYPHRSKYNPWRAYAWDSAERKTHYLGAFPSVPLAREAQQSFYRGELPTSGTKAVSLKVVGRKAA